MADEIILDPEVETNHRELAVQTPRQLPTLQEEMSLEQVEARVDKVRELHKRLMKPDIHFGVIPGTQKPTLLKPGAELILMTFMLDPQYTYEVKQEGNHREIITTCTLFHIPTGRRVASGVGCCSTMESKYRWRYAQPECPECSHELMRSKFKPGWYCNSKRGGCGKDFSKSDSRIKDGGKVENPDLADQYNTVLKMSSKRSLIDAALKATAASEAYTQDMEDFSDEREDDTPPPREEKKLQARSDPPPARQTAAMKEAAPTPKQPDSKPAAQAPATATAPSQAGDDVAPLLSSGQVNLLKAVLRGSHMLVDDTAIFNTIAWLAERCHVELEYEDGKSATENLDNTLRKIRIPANKIAELRTAIQQKGAEVNVTA